jgi:hypothetical protein
MWVLVDHPMPRHVDRDGRSIQGTTRAIGVPLVYRVPDDLLIQVLKQRLHTIAELGRLPELSKCVEAIFLALLSPKGETSLCGGGLCDLPT